jgi:hypothetical protein
MTLWEDHLLPLLTCKDSARLGCTCKALKEVVREHFKEVGRIKAVKVQAALTTFPKARAVKLCDIHQLPWVDQEVEALVQWLREGGWGRRLEKLGVERDSRGPLSRNLILRALRAGALPSLKSVEARLELPTHRAYLTEGLVAAMHELRLEVYGDGDPVEVEPQLAALGLVRQLPALAKLTVSLGGDFEYPVPWPPFIPPSLKSLRIRIDGECSATESLLQAFPGMLGASGAMLERLEVSIPSDFEAIGDGLVYLAQALRSCSTTLRDLRLGTWDCEPLQAPWSQGYASQVERLRVHWTDVLAGVSACRELQVLALLRIKVEPLFPPGTAFGRLIHLEIWNHEGRHSPNAGMMGLWELLASGGLPALAKLSLAGDWECVEEVRTRVVPAFEAVAGTLTHLFLGKSAGQENDELDIGYELGLAVGKLRRLKDLALDLSDDGRAYDAVARGLAASGGDHALPLLWRVILPSRVRFNSDLLASLLLQSVRVFRSHHEDSQAALPMACALRRVGYKHTWLTRWIYADGVLVDSGRAVLLAISSCRVLCEDWFNDKVPSWVILPHFESRGDD